ncbi:MAG: hypothetical protein OEZ34_16965, partial [Spirochaetia bacterium]|nr:hypothetical protein [Spirochaetia bacterium]
MNKTLIPHHIHEFPLRVIKEFIPLLVLIFIFSAFSRINAEMPQKVTGESERDYFELLFLYERTKSHGQIERIYRPILPVYGNYKNEEKAYRSKFFLYPVYHSHGTNYWKKWSFLHIFTGDKFYHEKSGK